MDKEAALEIVRHHASKLGEHFDSVRVFVTLPSNDGSNSTVAVDSGNGNFHAQLGQVAEWLTIQEEYQRDWARKQCENEGE